MSRCAEANILAAWSIRDRWLGAHVLGGTVRSRVAPNERQL